MSDYSYLSILKTCAKKLARIQKIKLSKALEIVARDAKFTSYHELSEVAKRAPLEQRLVFRCNRRRYSRGCDLSR